jgi:hypothetical protein
MTTVTPAEAARKKPKKRKRGRVGRWFTSFSGILASLATIVAAVAGLFAAHQTSRVNSLTIVVEQKDHVIAQKNRQIQLASRNPAPSSTPAPSSSVSGGAPAGGGAYLSSLQATVDNTGIQTGPQIMSATTYNDSVTLNCYGQQGNGQPDEAYNVAGHTVFKAVVGIPDNASNATSLDETVIFTNQAGTQLGKPVTVSLGKPATVQLNITSVTQLGMTCTGINTQTQQQDNNNIVTLGNASIS